MPTNSESNVILQFVNFTEIMARNIPAEQKEAAFALAALMEIPSQFKAAVSYNLLKLVCPHL